MKKQISKKVIVIVLISALLGGFQISFAKTVVKNSKTAKRESFVTIQVPGNAYKTSFKDGESLYEVMENLSEKKSSRFSFHSKNYSSLGNFVDEINGLKGNPGHYWIYYINNKKAPVGVSKYIVKSGDIIKWVQEGI